MEDFYRFCAIMAVVTGLLALLDKRRIFGSGKDVVGLDVAHISFGAAAAIADILMTKSSLKGA